VAGLVAECKQDAKGTERADDRAKEDFAEARAEEAPSGPLFADLIIDPQKRDEFRNRELGIRLFDGDIAKIALARDHDLREQFDLRRSYRRYSLKPIGFEQFGAFLSCLRRIDLDGRRKYLYASPGALYPTQVYLHVKPGRVLGLVAGTYYYDPRENALVELRADAEIDRDIHYPSNRLIYDEAAFSIFLILDHRAISPMYGEQSVHFATIEAGIMSHLLEMRAPDEQIGLCQIGSLDFGAIRDLFLLEASHTLLHSLLGGRIEPDTGPRALASEIRGRADSPAKAADILKRLETLTEDEAANLLDNYGKTDFVIH